MAVTKQVHSVKTRCSIRHNGFTLIEVIIAITIAAITSTIASIAYHGYIESRNIPKAISHIAHVTVVLDKYIRQYNHYPDALADIGIHVLRDPWGNPYQYNVARNHCADMSKKVYNIGTLKTDFDQYSMGKDGASVSLLSTTTSRDDVIRANNGNYIGLATDY